MHPGMQLTAQDAAALPLYVAADLFRFPMTSNAAVSWAEVKYVHKKKNATMKTLDFPLLNFIFCFNNNE